MLYGHVWYAIEIIVYSAETNLVSRTPYPRAGTYYPNPAARSFERFRSANKSVQPSGHIVRLFFGGLIVHSLPLSLHTLVNDGGPTADSFNHEEGPSPCQRRRERERRQFKVLVEKYITLLDAQFQYRVDRRSRGVYRKSNAY